MRQPRLRPLSALILAAATAPGLVHADTSSIGLHWLELTQLLPAPTYDPFASEIPRRRPGHPYERWMPSPPQNPDNIDPAPVDQVGEFLPVPDRWRIMESLGFKHPWYDPYNQNQLKADKPVIGKDWFLNLLAVSDTLIEPRSLPTPAAPQAPSEPGTNDTLGDVDQLIAAQTFIASAVLYKGDTTFKPPTYEFKATLAFNYNRVRTEETRALTIDPTFGETRDDGFVGVQELFFTWDYSSERPRYDFDDFRIGIQPFSSDFRGFLFQDNQPGIRFFGTRDSNRWQYNFAWFRRLEKDLNSGLNDITESPRKDDIFVANLYRQDFPFTGFTSQATVLHNRNRETDSFYDSNGFIVRPAAIGREAPREYDVTYLGYNGDGHIGRLNLTVSGYYAIGKQSAGVFIADGTDIRAGFLAAEASMDFDWIRARLSAAYASGDDDPFDDRSTGYDAVFENPIFAGADTSYWIRQNVPLIGGGGVAISQRNGLLPDLRPSKEQGQSNFDNPGLRLIGIGADFDLTPQTRLSGNINQLWFDKTEILEAARNQADIGRGIGTDVSVAWIWRPYATQNIVWRLSGAALLPGAGFKDLYGDQKSAYYSVLGNLILTY
ncbi:hypothetical protein DFR29_112197 [Tahibacter aquaticus]|uniref:Alginate export protein n=1 Tax=Tahibacter aquaticus TaxID=520092 RepID=A0A4R6YSA5_9GAMM|nr:hypothetical protein [Tahibacter aquaticus]TDR40883.1 hypothetical protein DFR29_112197 [Tahibacter aquaticus]